MMKNALKNLGLKSAGYESAQALNQLSARELERVSGGRFRPGLYSGAVGAVRHTAPPVGVRRRIDGRYVVQVQ